jgi:hypothetical protein
MEQKVKFCSKSETSRVIRYEEYLVLLTFLFFFLYFFQNMEFVGPIFMYCFNTTVSADAGIEPRTAVVYTRTMDIRQSKLLTSKLHLILRLFLLPCMTRLHAFKIYLLLKTSTIKESA